MTLLEKIRENIRQALDERAAKQADMDALLATVEAESRSDLSADETTKFGELRTAVTGIDQRVQALQVREAELVEVEEARGAAAAAGAALPARQDPPAAPALTETPGTPVQVRSEPKLYRRNGEHSYFRDLVRAYEPGGNRDHKALERIQRHAQETMADVEVRANMSRTDGAGGEFVPPAWLMDQYVPLARAARVTADLCRDLPLPSGTDSINLPKIATGVATAEQTEGSAVQKTDMTTTSVSAAVTTIAGQQVFSMQLLDQSPLNVDEIVFGDLMADLATRVDAYVIAKASIGILNISGAISVTYTDASPTVGEAYSKFADGIQQVQTNRFLPPQAHVMHPRRWAWFLAALDTAGRPLVVPSAVQGPQNAFAGFTDVRAEGSVGTLQGLPVFVDPNIPINLGAGTNEDRVITARFDDMYLYESAVRTRTLFETDADTLSVRLQLWEYAAFLGGRYPKSVAIMSGTGLITPTF